MLLSLCRPDGYLYEREAILEYILHQKKEIARQMKVMEAEERRAMAILDFIIYFIYMRGTL